MNGKCDEIRPNIIEVENFGHAIQCIKCHPDLDEVSDKREEIPMRQDKFIYECIYSGDGPGSQSNKCVCVFSPPK